MSLLSENDYKTLASALRNQRELTLERSLGKTHLTARTLHAKPPWGVPMILQVRVVKGGFFWVQNFPSIEEAQKYVKE